MTYSTSHPETAIKAEPLPRSSIDALGLDTAIRLRWALRDVRGKRTKLTPVNADDLQTLLELGLVEMHGETAVLTSEGDRALGWN